MDRLILLRHGEAERRAPSGRDFDRALTAAGRAAAVTVGRALAARGVTPDVVLVSTALRARQTWDDAASAWSTQARLMEEARLYNAPGGVIFDLAAAQGADSVLVVAHNPGLQDLAASLGAEAAFADGMAPAATAVLVRGPHGWSLAFTHTPPET